MEESIKIVMNELLFMHRFTNLNSDEYQAITNLMIRTTFTQQNASVLVKLIHHSVGAIDGLVIADFVDWVNQTFNYSVNMSGVIQG